MQMTDSEIRAEYNTAKNKRKQVDILADVGDIMLVGVKGDEFADLPVDYHTMRKLFPELWMNREER